VRTTPLTCWRRCTVAAAEDPGRDDLDWERLNYALDVLGEFRTSFQYPLTKVTMGLSAMSRPSRKQ
jgi:hypothetical protein